MREKKKKRPGSTPDWWQANEQSAGGSNGVRDKIIQMLIHAVCQRKVERASVSVKLTLSSLSS